MSRLVTVAGVLLASVTCFVADDKSDRGEQMKATVLARADHPMAKPAKPVPPVTLLEGMGNHHHPVSTKNLDAQKFFDQGLTLIFSFNHDEAARSFARAAELDPNLAMAYWGVALANGPNYNLSDPPREMLRVAYEASQKALKLSEKVPEPEQDYIRALTKRYAADPKTNLHKLAVAYKDEMSRLVHKYPDDLDAAILYGESAMNLHPWQLWTSDGKPVEGTEQVVALLESVLSRNPNHPGAVHFYIHAVEMSPHPEYALACADRLASLVPGAGHMVHMPSHIYFRTGDYAAAAKSNEQATAIDQAFFKGRKVEGYYATMYFLHNVYFATAAHCFQGRFADAKKYADLVASYAEPLVPEMQMLEGFLTAPPQVLFRFSRWDDILAAPVPDAKRPTAKACWHFARACASLAKEDMKKAEREREDFLTCKKAVPADAMVSLQNTSQSLLDIIESVLNAKFALAGGDRGKAIAFLRRAVEKEHALNYAEPPDWNIPPSETLGALLLANGDAAEAEKIFRAELKHHPRSGRALFGLRESLKAQKKDYTAGCIDREFQAAWKHANPKELRLADY